MKISSNNAAVEDEFVGCRDGHCDNADRIATALQTVPAYALAAIVIDLDALAYNYHSVKKELRANSSIAAVVKANAYGFGMIPVSKRLYREGCKVFFVATIDEGIKLRDALPQDTKIFVLAGVPSKCDDIMHKYNLVPVLNSMQQVRNWSGYCKKIGSKLEAAVHIDTGINRNGIPYRYVEQHRDEIINNLNISFVISHLACADTLHHPMNDLQLHRFREVMKVFGRSVRGSFSATNGFFLGEDFMFDMVRLGKSLYGFSIRDDKIGSLTPVMNAFARIVQVSELKVGDTVGYGATFTANRATKTATIGIGYADGFMRKFSAFGHGFIGGKKIPVIGRISMDFVVFDVTEVDDYLLKEGDWVALTRTPDNTMEKWALELGTLPHEVTCRFGPRATRVYLGEE
ncbi:MAG: alanine racemase [Holosporaceae bacterium]|jgi:alanine racemase|nr:alanine racemase [Holosporaceae bacterium]